MLVLVDSGSTHNFINPNVVKKIQISTNADVKIKVCRANGALVDGFENNSGVPLLRQGNKFPIDFHVLTMLVVMLCLVCSGYLPRSHPLGFFKTHYDLFTFCEIFFS